MGEAPSRYLNTREAAAHLGVSRRTLESYRVTGGGPPFLAYCNRIHYLRGDLDHWARSARKRSTSDSAGAGQDRGKADSSLDAGPGAKTAEDAGFFDAGTGERLGTKKLAALLRVSGRTLARYRARGLGPAFEKVNGKVRYLRNAVEAWLADSRRLSTSDEGGETPGDAPASPEGGR